MIESVKKLRSRINAADSPVFTSGGLNTTKEYGTSSCPMA